MHQRGFTLLELIVVLLILGILAAAAAPRFAASMDGFRVESAARRIEQDLAYACELAKTTSVRQAIVFDSSHDCYELPGVPDLAHRNQDYRVDLAAAPYQVDLLSAEFGVAKSATSTVTYNVFGRADLPGTIVVRSGAAQETVHVEVYVPTCPAE